MSETALSYVKAAIRGEIDAVVPYPALFGAHVVLTNYYGFSNADASRVMRNLMDARRIHWYDGMPEQVVRDGFARAASSNVEGWDGYYAQVAIEEGVETILTLDDDFEDIEGVAAEVVLSADEFATLDEYVDA